VSNYFKKEEKNSGPEHDVAKQQEHNAKHEVSDFGQSSSS